VKGLRNGCPRTTYQIKATTTASRHNTNKIIPKIAPPLNVLLLLLGLEPVLTGALEGICEGGWDGLVVGYKEDAIGASDGLSLGFSEEGYSVDDPVGPSVAVGSAVVITVVGVSEGCDVGFSEGIMEGFNVVGSTLGSTLGPSASSNLKFMSFDNFSNLRKFFDTFLTRNKSIVSSTSYAIAQERIRFKVTATKVSFIFEKNK